MEKIYPYAVSKIKVRENKLLTKLNLEQLAAEKSVEKIVSILRDREYDFDMIQKPEDFENEINQGKLYYISFENQHC